MTTIARAAAGLLPQRRRTARVYVCVYEYVCVKQLFAGVRCCMGCYATRQLQFRSLSSLNLRRLGLLRLGVLGGLQDAGTVWTRGVV